MDKIMNHTVKLIYTENLTGEEVTFILELKTECLALAGLGRRHLRYIQNC